MLLQKRTKIKSIIIALTNQCSLKCKMCTIWKEQPKKNIKPNIIKKIFSSKILEQDFSLTLTGGEPFLSPYFNEIIEEILFQRPESLKTISTNGIAKEKILQFLKKYRKHFPNLSLSISFDGINNHDLQRGKSKDKILFTIKEIKKKFPDLLIKLKLTITPINYSDIIPTYNYCKKLGVKFKIKISESSENYTNKIEEWQPNWTQNMKESIKKDLEIIEKEISNSDNKNADFIKRTISSLDEKKHLKKCLAPYERIFIMPDTSVYSCIHLKKLGYLNEKSLDDLFTSNISKENQLIAENKLCKGCVSFHGSG